MENKENKNRKIEQKHNKAEEAKHSLAYSKKLNEQDINENFLNLKKELIFYQEKDKIDEIRANLNEETEFLKISDEIEPSMVKENGLDFAIIADVSESMYPYRVYLKKSMYMAIKDIESFIYRALENAEDDLPKVRLAIVKYTDRTSASEQSKVDVLDFIDYTSLDKLMEKIDEIEIKQFSQKKRAVFDGMKSLSELSWGEETIKIVLHYAADPEYGIQYTTNPKKMGDDYDPFPNGLSDIKKEDILEPLSNLSSTYNFVSFNDKLLKFTTAVQEDLTLDVNSPEVVELN